MNNIILAQWNNNEINIPNNSSDKHSCSTRACVSVAQALSIIGTSLSLFLSVVGGCCADVLSVSLV